jgi:hypothetical protein
MLFFWRPLFMKRILLYPACLAVHCALFSVGVSAEDRPELRVSQCEDFEVTGRGDAGAWEKITWTDLQPRGDEPTSHSARVKMLYSDRGLYLLMQGSDRRLTATLREDFANLWTEDVFEFFLWPDERFPLYFEYEISPLGYELPILIPNLDDKFLGWRPWHYEGERKIKKQVSVTGGPAEPGAEITGWTAEVFVPYAVLEPLTNVPPRPGARWRANFYRVDYDEQRSVSWDWSRVGPSFHEYKKFGTLVFE